jgi:hypothetical protein
VQRRGTVVKGHHGVQASLDVARVDFGTSMLPFVPKGVRRDVCARIEYPDSAPC